MCEARKPRQSFSSSRGSRRPLASQRRRSQLGGLLVVEVRELVALEVATVAAVLVGQAERHVAGLVQEDPQPRRTTGRARIADAVPVAVSIRPVAYSRRPRSDRCQRRRRRSRPYPCPRRPRSPRLRSRRRRRHRRRRRWRPRRRRASAQLPFRLASLSIPADAVAVQIAVAGRKAIGADPVGVEVDVLLADPVAVEIGVAGILAQLALLLASTSASQVPFPLRSVSPTSLQSPSELPSRSDPLTSAEKRRWSAPMAQSRKQLRWMIAPVSAKL